MLHFFNWISIVELMNYSLKNVEKMIELTYTTDCYQKCHTDRFLLLIDVNTFEIFMPSQAEVPGLMECMCVT